MAGLDRTTKLNETDKEDLTDEVSNTHYIYLSVFVTRDRFDDH